MNKGRKIKYDFCKAQVIKCLAKEFDKSESYIRMILNDAYKPAFANEVKKRYEERYQRLVAAAQ
ncbi:hypothetical protein KTO58_19885 [Chitinophaga pendula]|uniref:hypothetical protein n=1 Tax=Chitinophaga TaxID=79328 RepID=UPI000BB07A25|nr:MULTISPECIES: hypothetical protein [Chitinophaga]ASZ11070.1 hypothetical protein CK934_08910 [Chitinophaga sp. MD30]UCJ05932.1 hypothetical protein KTO58_19885 [Chitinophaga pendula]